MPPIYIRLSYDFLMPLLVLLIIVSFLTFFYFNRHSFSCRRNNKYAHRDPSKLEETLSLPLTGRTAKVILVYDMTDDLIKERACSLRRQFIASGISIVMLYYTLISSSFVRSLFYLFTVKGLRCW